MVTNIFFLRKYLLLKMLFWTELFYRSINSIKPICWSINTYFKNCIIVVKKKCLLSEVPKFEDKLYGPSRGGSDQSHWKSASWEWEMRGSPKGCKDWMLGRQNQLWYPTSRSIMMTSSSQQVVLPAGHRTMVSQDRALPESSGSSHSLTQVCYSPPAQILSTSRAPQTVLVANPITCFSNSLWGHKWVLVDWHGCL